jgi:hypothetical protein
MANGPILAVVQKVGPDAHVTRGGERLPLPPGTVLLPGDEIETASSTLTILFPETGVSRMEPGSRVTLVADPNAPSSTNLFAELKLTAGSVWTRFERLLGPSEWFSVEANGVVATVRGTGFGVTLTQDILDIQVADHTVSVFDAPDILAQIPNSTWPMIHVQAGEGFRIGIANIDGGLDSVADLRAYTRTLNRQEVSQEPFIFSATKLAPSMLHLPGVLRRLPVTPVLDSALIREFNLNKTMQAIFPQKGFQAPARGILPSEQAPTGTQIVPVIEGPIE